MFVRREAVVCTCFDEDGGAFAHRHLLTLHLEQPRALEHDVELVVLVRLLTIGLGCNQHVDTHLEPDGLVHDRVTAVSLAEFLLDGSNLERVHDPRLREPGRPVHPNVDRAALRLSRSAPAPLADGKRQSARHPSAMGSCAIWWTEADGPRCAGKLELGTGEVVLSGAGRGRIAYTFGDIESLDYRGGELMLEVRPGRLLRIGSLDAPGALREIASYLLGLWRPSSG
jgi:hypothetical protein